ncbi:hypothetical protein FRC02_000923 [Tulasnella sp. 418]|nr:hypothetical protein FRC02_000923 [Tulasnella sp. 418]
MVKWSFKKLKNSWSTVQLDGKNNRVPQPSQTPILAGRHVQRVVEESKPALEDEEGVYVIPEDPDHPADPHLQIQQHKYPWRFPDGDDSDTCCSEDEQGHSAPRRAASLHGVAGLGANGKTTQRTRNAHRRSESARHSHHTSPRARHSSLSHQAMDSPRRPLDASAPNPWKEISHQSFVLSRELMTMMMDSLLLHPMLTALPGRVPLYFDVRRDIRDAQQANLSGTPNFKNLDGSESAVMPRVAYMKIIFRTSHEVIELSNPSGVTCMQVLAALSKWAKSLISEDLFRSFGSSYQQYIMEAYRANRMGKESDGMRQYDLLLGCVYFGGLNQDQELVRQRFGWNDPTVFVAVFEDKDAISASGIMKSEEQVNTPIQLPWRPMGN